MAIVSLLATEEGGLGLNFDILETNLINLAIVIGILVYFGRKFLGNTLSQRRASIEEAITEAEQRKQKASAALAEQQQRLAQAKAEARQILAKAEESAAKARETILAEAQEDIERMKANAARDLTSQQERVLQELRQRVVALAMEQVEAELPHRLDADYQRRLIDRSIALLTGGRS
ncbi:ATP synthase subunit b [Halomicronema hongdechloris C2206]|uniref:ATP synthase subunit b n=1 Tax=Halomicronema hongdechloris C2206 TaxID=1641165 RepID=A0A1Z3HPW1_9CYAN|nr:F0F1 ATP synthase subunit B [Halomicronema hongdechloris]ASC72343.1 ATP synthase subunit b [Halomicronema hongdechloris C2206]